MSASMVQMNGTVLYGRSHLNASALMRGIKDPIVSLVVSRRAEALEELAVRPDEAALLEQQQRGSRERSPSKSRSSPQVHHASPPLEQQAPPAAVEVCAA